ncbi:MAG: hypothetical protein ACE5JD_17080 [Candidatus Methylomirabilia bacterium]
MGQEFVNDGLRIGRIVGVRSLRMVIDGKLEQAQRTLTDLAVEIRRHEETDLISGFCQTTERFTGRLRGFNESQEGLGKLS